MVYRIISGYSGLFRPPMPEGDRRNCAMFCITTDSKRTLLAMPFTPHFFEDLYNMIKHPQYQKLILVVPSTDCIYISDIYNIYSEVTVNLKKAFQLVCPEEVTIPTSDHFLSHVVHGQHVDVTVFHDEHEKEQLSAVIDFNGEHMSPARKCYDIILSTTQFRYYFTFYMNHEKVEWLRANPFYYTEIHMPFTNATYGGLDYMHIRNSDDRDIVKNFVPHLHVHSFRSVEEANYCRSAGIPCGEVIYNDLV